MVETGIRSPQPSDDTRPSFLAVIETIVASALFAWLVNISVEGDRPIPRFILAAILVAPLALVRTHWSTEIGLADYGRLIAFVEAIEKWRDEQEAPRWAREMRQYFCFAFFLLFIPLLMFAIRVHSFALGVCYHPLDSLKAIPANWFRTVFVQDIFFLPEAVPGVETSSYTRFRYREHLGALFNRLRTHFSDRGIFFGLVYVSGSLLYWAFLFVPGMLVRWSLKSSWLAWSPIIYSAYKASPERKSLAERMDYIMTSPRERGARYVASLHLIFVSMHVYLAFVALNLTSAFTSIIQDSVTFLVNIFLWAFGWAALVEISHNEVLTLRVWGILSVTNAVITFSLLFIADDFLRRSRLGYPTKTSPSLVTSLLAARSLFGVILIIKMISDVVPRITLPGHIRIIF